MITRSFDEADCIIFVAGSGIWTADEVDDHFTALASMIRELRNTGRPVRILSDLTAAQRQARAIEHRIRRHQQDLYRAGDRVALLVLPTDKPHVVGLLGYADLATFNSRLAAEMWLVTADLRRPA